MSDPKALAPSARSSPTVEPPKVVATTVITAEATAFSGPIPPPGMLAEYDRVSPGLALRLVEGTEAEASHRRALESRILDAQIADRAASYSEARWGQVCAFAVAVAGVMVGAYVAIHGKEWAGSIISLTGVGGIVTSFIAGRHGGSGKPDPETSVSPKSESVPTQQLVQRQS